MGGGHNWRFYGQIAFTLFLIICLLWWIRPGRIWAVVSAADPFLFGASLLFTPAVIGVKVLRWWLLIRAVNPNITFRESMSSYLAGLTLATITPLAAGEFGRGYFVFGDANRAALTGKLILDKAVDLSAVILFACMGMILLGNQQISLLGIMTILSLFATWLGAIFFLPRLDTFLARFRWFHTVLQALSQTTGRQLLINSALAFIGFTIFYLQAFILLRGVWPAATWAVLPTFPIITFSTILPIAVGGVGIREWTAVLLLANYQIPAEAAFTAFFGHFVIVQLLPALLGVPMIVNRWPKRASQNGGAV